VEVDGEEEEEEEEEEALYLRFETLIATEI